MDKTIKLPKYALATIGPLEAWGVVRLRSPVILAEFARVNVGGMVSIRQPYIWPPDALTLTTDAKFHRSLTKMWRIFEEDTEDLAEVRMYAFDLARPLPPFLVLDDDASDFTGVLDTERGILWSVSEDLRYLSPQTAWKMHPAIEPAFDLPPAALEVHTFWKNHLEECQRADEEQS